MTITYRSMTAWREAWEKALDIAECSEAVVEYPSGAGMDDLDSDEAIAHLAVFFGKVIREMSKVSPEADQVRMKMLGHKRFPS